MSDEPGTIEVTAEDLVLRPVDETFDAVVNPAVLSHYFISAASGPLVGGTTVQWTFADVSAGATLDIAVSTVEHPKVIAFEWSVTGAPTRVEITFEPIGADKTRVRVVEREFPMTEQGVRTALGQTTGWTDFLCCMKGYLQHGVNLREGRELLR